MRIRKGDLVRLKVSDWLQEYVPGIIGTYGQVTDVHNGKINISFPSANIQVTKEDIDEICHCHWYDKILISFCTWLEKLWVEYKIKAT